MRPRPKLTKKMIYIFHSYFIASQSPSESMQSDGIENSLSICECFCWRWSRESRCLFQWGVAFCFSRSTQVHSTCGCGISTISRLTAFDFVNIVKQFFGYIVRYIGRPLNNKCISLVYLFTLRRSASTRFASHLQPPWTALAAAVAASSVSVSAWTLVAISCERYYAICHPLRSRRWQTLRHSYKLIALIWCGSLVCMSPIAFLSQLIPTNNGKHICTHTMCATHRVAA